jgi:hypothetical protein
VLSCVRTGPWLITGKHDNGTWSLIAGCATPSQLHAGMHDVKRICITLQGTAAIPTGGSALTLREPCVV